MRGKDCRGDPFATGPAWGDMELLLEPRGLVVPET